MLFCQHLLGVFQWSTLCGCRLPGSGDVISSDKSSPVSSATAVVILSRIPSVIRVPPAHPFRPQAGFFQQLVHTVMPHGDLNVPAGWPTLEVDLTQPMRLPCIEQSRNFSKLSRLILDIRELISREQRLAGGVEDAGRSNRAEPAQAPSPVASVEESAANGPDASENWEQQPQDLQAFVLAEEVVRNGEYPRSCRV
ncbi:F-box only protein 31-B-like isoform X2 [Lithobates pipiens]